MKIIIISLLCLLLIGVVGAFVVKELINPYPEIEEDMTEQEFEELAEQYPNETAMTPEQEELFNQVTEEYWAEIEQQIDEKYDNPQFRDIEIPEMEMPEIVFERYQNKYIEVLK